jgi:hypothetical protein
VAVANPSEYSVNLVNHPGLSFGLVGGIVAAADVSSKSKTFTQQQVDKYLALGPELTAALREELSGAGFQVVDVQGPADPRTEFLKDYPAAECDAFLDATIRVAGYWAQYPSTPYLPTIFAPVRVVDARSQKVLYTTQVFNTDGIVPKGGTQIQPDTAYSFADFESRSHESRRRNEEGSAQRGAADRLRLAVTDDARPPPVRTLRRPSVRLRIHGGGAAPVAG